MDDLKKFDQEFKAEFGFICDGYLPSHIQIKIKGLRDNDWNTLQVKNCVMGSAAWAWKERQKIIDHQSTRILQLESKLSQSEIDKSTLRSDYCKLLGDKQKQVDELQAKVDAVKQLIEEYRDPPTEDKTFSHALSIVADELEQALKGGEA